LVNELYGEIRNFFVLPIETKHSYEIPGIGGQRGYVSLEQNMQRKKEGFERVWHFGQYV
jgi:isopenicillin N synthase-like dioxygenase